jgi:hypothetical protein
MLAYGFAIGIVPPSWIVGNGGRAACSAPEKPPAADGQSAAPAPDLPLSPREREVWAALEERLR